MTEPTKKLLGFSGRLAPETANYRPDMEAIAGFARRLGAQFPSSIQKTTRQLAIKKRKLRLAMSRWLKKQRSPGNETQTIYGQAKAKAS